jgi:hypothetical protein
MLVYHGNPPLFLRIRVGGGVTSQRWLANVYRGAFVDGQCRGFIAGAALAAACSHSTIGPSGGYNPRRAKNSDAKSSSRGSDSSEE